MPPFFPSRRQMLRQSAGGLGSLALAGMLGRQSHAAAVNPLAPHVTHLPAKAKSVIFLYMTGEIGRAHV